MPEKDATRMPIAVRKPKFHLTGVVPSAFFIDRTREVQLGKSFLIDGKGNILLAGKRMVGKSSFAAKIRYELENSSILTAEVNLMAYNESPSQFLNDVVLLLCYRIGQKVFNKSTSDLLRALDAGFSNLKRDYKHFLEVYQLARGLNSSSKKKTEIEAKVSGVVASGRLGADTEKQVTVGPLRPLEFVHLADELADICRNEGLNSIVVFADEANRLPVQTSTAILREFFDMFLSRNVSFVFVADLSLLDYSPATGLFEETIILRPFEEIRALYELVSSYYGSVDSAYQQVFTEEALARIWMHSKGHPYLIQLLCSCCHDLVVSRGSGRLHSCDVDEMWIRSIEHDPQLVKLW